MGVIVVVMLHYFVEHHIFSDTWAPHLTLLGLFLFWLCVVVTAPLVLPALAKIPYLKHGLVFQLQVGGYTLKTDSSSSSK